MLKRDEIIENLKSSKVFVDKNSDGKNAEVVEDIQACLSAAIEAATNNDTDTLEAMLSEIEKHKISEWNLTSEVRKLLEKK